MKVTIPMAGSVTANLSVYTFLGTRQTASIFKKKKKRQVESHTEILGNIYSLSREISSLFIHPKSGFPAFLGPLELPLRGRASRLLFSSLSSLRDIWVGKDYSSTVKNVSCGNVFKGNNPKEKSYRCN